MITFIIISLFILILILSVCIDTKTVEEYIDENNLYSINSNLSSDSDS